MFRGIDIKTGEWVEGWYASCTNNQPLGNKLLHFILLPVYGDWGFYDFKRIKVHPDSIAMNTGQVDKNGKPIYGNKCGCGGDKILVTHRKYLIDGDYEKIEQFEANVYFDETMGGWYYEPTKYSEGGFYLSNCKCEIIGTQWDKEKN